MSTPGLNTLMNAHIYICVCVSTDDIVLILKNPYPTLALTVNGECRDSMLSVKNKGQLSASPNGAFLSLPLRLMEHHRKGAERM